ncbi:MAG: uracil-DNA glycosylase [Candidatus Pacebacteria bacterium]|nr:uracil-DNA glycosylase [Candidatus Paceibacterota bacterium]
MKNRSIYESLPPSLGWLAWYAALGVDEAMSEEAICHFVEPATRPTAPTVAPTRVAAMRPIAPRGEPIVAPPQNPSAGLRGLAEAKTRAAASQSIPELFAAIDGFDLCPLHRTAEKTVIGDGVSPDAGQVKVMVVGGVPDEEEDKQGIAFGSREGKSLDQILATIDLSRQGNCYLAKAIFWRPPGQREPTAQEIALCRPFLFRLIELVRPHYLLVLDSIAAEVVSGKPVEVVTMRGQWLTEPYLQIPTLVTFSPKTIANSAVKKKLVWRDLLKLQAKIIAG